MAYKRPIDWRALSRQRGAVMVETALVALLFLILVLAIIEFALAMFKYASVVEGVRAGARWAIVNDPVCDIYGDGVITPACAGTVLAKETDPTNGNFANCTGCPLVMDCTGECANLLAEMNAVAGIYGESIEGRDVTVRYACPGTTIDTNPGFPESPRILYLVTVEVGNANNGVDYQFFVPGLFGLPAQVGLPQFSLSRLSEDLKTTYP